MSIHFGDSKKLNSKIQKRHKLFLLYWYQSHIPSIASFLDKKLHSQKKRKKLFLLAPPTPTFKPVQIQIQIHNHIQNKDSIYSFEFITHSWPTKLNHFPIVQEEEMNQSSIWENGQWKQELVERATTTIILEDIQVLT